MESSKIISIAERKTGEKNKTAQLSSFGISSLILISDIIWFVIRRNRYSNVGWWEIVILVVSGLFFIFSLLGLMFSSSNANFNKKVSDKPLIAFDTDKNVFIVQSFVEFKEKEFAKDDVKSITINPETDEVTLNYVNNDKEKTLIVGYTDYRLEKEINDLINKYKIEE